MALNTQMGKLNSWIIDSNASSHMTSNVVLFHTCSPSSRNFLVQIVDRSLSKVVGIGFIAITDDLVPNFVLFVPNLTCNLLSIRKLRIWIMLLIFFSQVVVNFRTRNRGGWLAMCGKVLTILKKQTQVANSMSFLVFSNLFNNNSAIMLWHNRLCHLNLFLYQKVTLYIIQ